MEQQLKERLIGATVLVTVAVIMIPIILDDSVQKDVTITETNIPPRPDNQFNTRVVPIKQNKTVVPVSGSALLQVLQLFSYQG